VLSDGRHLVLVQILPNSSVCEVGAISVNVDMLIEAGRDVGSSLPLTEAMLNLCKGSLALNIGVKAQREATYHSAHKRNARERDGAKLLRVECSATLGAVEEGAPERTEHHLAFETALPLSCTLHAQRVSGTVVNLPGLGGYLPRNRTRCF